MFKVLFQKSAIKLYNNLGQTVALVKMSSLAKNPLVSVCQMTSTSDKDENFSIVCDLVADSKQKNASIAFLPEACDYIADNKADAAAMSEKLNGPTVQKYRELACKEDIWLSIGGIHITYPELPGKVQNCHLIIDNKGQIVSEYRKIHLFDMENKKAGVRLMESDYVEKGDKITPPIPTPVGKIGLGICYDMRFPELSLCLRKMGAEILTYPSAFTFQTGSAHWEILLRSRAIETQCFVIAAAQIGNHNKKRVSWGHAMVIDPWGTILAQCPDKQSVAIAEIDLSLLYKVRKNMPCAKHRRTDLYPDFAPKDT